MKYFTETWIKGNLISVTEIDDRILSLQEISDKLIEIETKIKRIEEKL